MQRTFEVQKGCEVIKSGKVYDLHNLYAPIALILDVRNRNVRMVFRPAPAPESKKNRVALVFCDVDVLEFNGNVGGDALSGLDEIGFKETNDYDYDWLSTEAQSLPTDHMVFRFERDVIVRMHGAHADVVEESVLREI